MMKIDDTIKNDVLKMINCIKYISLNITNLRLHEESMSKALRLIKFAISNLDNFVQNNEIIELYKMSDYLFDLSTYIMLKTRTDDVDQKTKAIKIYENIDVIFDIILKVLYIDRR